MKLNRRQIQRLILREMAEMGMGGNNMGASDGIDPRIALIEEYLKGYADCESGSEAYLLGYEVCKSGGGKTADGGIYPEGIGEPLIAFLESKGHSDPFEEGVGSDLLANFLASRGYK